MEEHVHKEKEEFDEVQHVEKPLRHCYLFSHLMKVRLSSLAFLLHMKLKKQLVSMMKN
jgi:hypothetical protein